MGMNDGGRLLRGVMIVLMLAVPRTGAAQRAVPEGAVWPVPPEAPRIRHTAVLYSDRDLGKKRSFFVSVRNAVAGTKDDVIAVSRPHDIHVDNDGRILLTNGIAPGFWVFDPRGKEARLVEPKGMAALGKPMGITADAHGIVYVADARGRRIVATDLDGNFVRAYGGREHLLNPVDVALSPAGDRLYVADSYMHQLVIFDRDGRLLTRIGRDEGDLGEKSLWPTNVDADHGLPDSLDAQDAALSHHRAPSDLVENRGIAPGQFRYPAFVAVGPDGTVFVSDGLNFRIQAFDSEGAFLFEFGRLGNGPGTFARPKGVAVDSDGHVYVVDAAFNNVQVFDERGRLLLTFGGFGNGPSDLWLPTGIAIDRQDGIFVADRVNNRIQIYQFLGSEAGTGGGP